MKKLLALLLAAVMCFSLVACGGGNEAGNNNELQTNESNSQQETENNEAAENNDAAAPILQENSEQQTNEDNTPNIVEIELTTENFDTYFELVEVPIFYENEFGETDEMDLYQYYLVREEYNVSDMSDFAVEYSCVWGRKNCEVDFTNQTYVLSDFNDTTPPSNVINDRFFDVEVNGLERFGFSIDGSGKAVRKKDGAIGEVGYSVDFEILRVKGTLFLIEE